MSSEKRKARRKAEREAERKRAEEIDKALEAPPLTPFEKPPAGRIVETPFESPKKEQDKD